MIKKEELRRLAEEKASHLTENLDALTTEQIKHTFHELRVHQIELEMQNEELRRSQKELDSERERYFDLYDLAPVGYITINEKGLILEVNLTAASMLGGIRSSAVNQAISQFILKEDQDIYYMYRKRLFETGNSQKCELRMVKKDKTVFWVHLEANIMQDHNGNLVNRVMISDITDRKIAEEQIKSLLAEKEIILKEVHHRIKNNMNTIHGLLFLQADTLKDPMAVSAFEETANRVQSMMVLYEKLYHASNFQELPIKEYFSSLIDDIISNFPNRTIVKIEKNIDDFIVSSKILFSFGIIINELLTNIMKYAFTGRDNGIITLSASLEGSRVSIIIQDNGNGIPESVDFENSTGFGLMLVGMLTKQIGGTIRIVRGNGTKIILEFDI
jgi:PAS domain S-box-containing protein